MVFNVNKYFQYTKKLDFYSKHKYPKTMSERKAEMLRKKAGYTSARKVAVKLGIPPSRLYMFEKDGANKARLRLVDAIELARLYQCGLDELLDEELSEQIFISDKSERPQEKKLSILESEIVKFIRFMPLANRLDVYAYLMNKINHPTFLCRDKEVEERMLLEMKEMQQNGEYDHFFNSEAIMDELIEEFYRINAKCLPLKASRTTRRKRPTKSKKD